MYIHFCCILIIIITWSWIFSADMVAVMAAAPSFSDAISMYDGTPSVEFSRWASPLVAIIFAKVISGGSEGLAMG